MLHVHGFSIYNSRTLHLEHKLLVVLFKTLIRMLNACHSVCVVKIGQLYLAQQAKGDFKSFNWQQLDLVLCEAELKS